MVIHRIRQASSTSTQSNISHSATTSTPPPLHHPSRQEILCLYRHLLRTARQYKSYNLNQYIRKRSKDAFHSHATEVDRDSIAGLYAKGCKDLEVARRQAYIQNVFSMGPLVVELNGKHK
ncbi:hypothetical protein SeLEV6574_g06631 [Synchytrium endobioticum]|uniref:Complex 1 LYR protein domain-containing protein n=1 Tax=Synchytrium endobioticum TaxID=286115 RepID=A0A507CMG7_9FUNG|nr:hypothetical protein SeLEV6574_g06631 [Synchytrium endobioticum]